MEDLFNILTLCNYCILGNVLDRRTYSFPGHTPKNPGLRLQNRIQYDYNALSPSDRYQFTYFRGLALNLISWLSCHYIATPRKGTTDEQADDDTIDIQELAASYLQRQASSLLNYKVRAKQVKYKGLEECSIADIQRQLELLFADGILGVDKSVFAQADVGKVMYFGCKPSEYLVGERNDPNDFQGRLI